MTRQEGRRCYRGLGSDDLRVDVKKRKEKRRGKKVIKSLASKKRLARMLIKSAERREELGPVSVAACVAAKINLGMLNLFLLKRPPF